EAIAIRNNGRPPSSSSTPRPRPSVIEEAIAIETTPAAEFQFHPATTALVIEEAIAIETTPAAESQFHPAQPSRSSSTLHEIGSMSCTPVCVSSSENMEAHAAPGAQSAMVSTSCTSVKTADA
ncbi:hypothetical protein ASPACDRAFT_47427, partial [Aspergillus aculeatus ATCC 16872]